MTTPVLVMGNPVFDYKASFRATAQSVQRILLYSGFIYVIVGIAARFKPVQDPAWSLTLHYAPLLGVATFALCGVWAFGWRNKLRKDFQREFALK